MFSEKEVETFLMVLLGLAVFGGLVLYGIASAIEWVKKKFK